MTGMPATKKKPGPPKQFGVRVDIRAPAADVEEWKAAAAASPSRLSLSQWIRGLANRAARTHKKATDGA